ncbi:MAG: hypothetical protein K5686_04880 [Lachnospiraceae bacterium]|nr:hypothetical protein [Lachnospiraceae bacterium]
MKKLLFVFVLMAALCACEAPGTKKGNTEEATELHTGNEGTKEDASGNSDNKGKVSGTGTAVKEEDNAGKATDEIGPTPTPGDKEITEVIPSNETNDPINIDLGNAADYAKGRELFCSADSEEEARAIAALYGITFVDFEYGIASFTTDEDPAAVVQRGKDNGWKSIEINYLSTIQ